MTYGLNLGEVEAFTFPGEDSFSGNVTTFSNKHSSDGKENGFAASSNEYAAYPDDVISRRQVQVKSTIKRALVRLASVSGYTAKTTPIDPQLAYLLHTR